MKHTFVLLCLSLLFGISCSEKHEDGNRPAPEKGKVQVVLPISESFEEAGAYTPAGDLPITRTLILGDGNLDKAAWAENDKISLWAKQEGTSDYILRAETFKYYTPLQGTALFSAAIPEMAPGTYIYYGAYPVPDAIDDTRVTYTLHAEQNGEYDGTYDIMLARPALGSELTAATPIDAVSMSFAHKCHILRIQVPTGRNKWGVEVKKLRIKFPAEVVGDLQFDVADPDAEPVFTNGSNTVTLNLTRPLDESEEDASDGNYVWVFLRPGVQLDGNLEFTAYSAEGYQSETLSAPISKTLAEGRITPITMSIPKELPVTYYDLSIGTNNLGEVPTKFTITIPEGTQLRNGKNTQSFTIDSENKYELAFYHSFDGRQNGETIRTGKSALQFESESALVSDTRALEVAITPGSHNACSLTVPYLLGQDFSNTATFNNNGSTGNTGGAEGNVSWADAAGLPGWSGNQYCIEGGKCVSIRHRYENGALATGTYRGRLDSSPMPLKEGVTVKVSVSFNYSGKTSNSKVTPQLTYGHTTNQDAMRGYYSPSIGGDGVKIENEVGSVKTNTSGSYDSVDQTISTFYIDNCTKLHRLSWDCVYSGSAFANFNNQWVFIDNIKVQIVK